MRAGVIGITHKDCWASETSKKFPHLDFFANVYKIGSKSYRVILKVSGTTDRTEYKGVKRELQKHPSLEEEFWVIPNEDCYHFVFTVNDHGYSTGAIRILIRTPGVHAYRFNVLPIKGGIECYPMFFDDEKSYKLARSRLELEANVEIKEVKSCKNQGLDVARFGKASTLKMEENKHFTFFPTVFNTVFNMSPSELQIFEKILTGDDKIFDELTEKRKRGFLDLIIGSRVAKLLIVFVTGVSDIQSLKEGYIFLEKLAKLKNPLLEDKD